MPIYENNQKRWADHWGMSGMTLSMIFKATWMIPLKPYFFNPFLNWKVKEHHLISLESALDSCFGKVQPCTEHHCFSYVCIAGQPSNVEMPDYTRSGFKITKTDDWLVGEVLCMHAQNKVVPPAFWNLALNTYANRSRDTQILWIATQKHSCCIKQPCFEVL